MAGVGPKLQLAAVGPQDVPLTVGAPPDTQPRWLQYANFGTGEETVPFVTPLAFGGTQTVTFPSSMADVLGPVILQVTLPALGAGGLWCASVGFRMIARLRLLVGDILTDDTDGLLHLLHASLHLTAGQAAAVHEMTGGSPLPTDRPHLLLVPLRLCFAEPGGPGLPLVAMTRSKLQLTITLAPLAALVAGVQGAPAGTDLTASLSVDTALLSMPERTSFLAAPYVLLVERTLSQDFSTVAVTNNHDPLPLPCLTLDLAFMQGPVKQVLLVFLRPDGSLAPALRTCALFVNNAQRGDTRPGAWYAAPSAYRRCRRCPGLPVYTVNFGLETSSAQPSGALDMSQAGTCFLQLTVDTAEPLVARVYAVAYRTLTFAQGLVT